MRQSFSRQDPAMFILCLVFGLMGGLFLLGGLIGLAFVTGGFASLPALTENSIAVLPVTFSILGAAFLAVVAVISAVRIKKRRMREALIAGGRQVLATVTDIVTDASVTVNGRPARRVECCYTDPETGKTYLYQSGRLFSAVSALRIIGNMGQSPFSVGMTVPVYIDRYDETKYFVDVNALLENVVDCR